MQKRPILIAFVMVVAGAARAEEPSSADVAAARELGREGAKLAEAGKCGEAIDKLRRAASIVSAPSIDVRLGECLVATGKLVEGTEVLQRVVRAPLVPGAPAVFVEARDRARRALDSALPKLGRLRIKLAARDGMTPSVTVDGVLVPAALLDVERPADPGEHVVEARAPGFIAATARINVVSGRTETVDLALAPAPVASASASVAPPPAPPPVSASAAPVPPPPPASAPAEPPRSPSSTARTAGWITVAAGGVFAVGGIVLGAVALQKRSSLDETCVDRRCPDRSQSDIDSMYATGRASTALFLVGGVALGAGAAVLLSTSPSSAAVVSPGGVAFRRTF